MPILLKTRVKRTAKTPIPACRARVGGLCGFQDTVERVPTGSLKTGRCASVRENRKFDRSPAQRVRSKEEMQRNGRDLPLAAGRGIWSLHRRKAGQKRGVVRAPRRSHLPAVRAVSGICEGVPKAAKNSWRALQYEKSPLFQGKQRGSDEIYEVNTEKWSKEKQNSRSGSHRSARSLLTPVIRTINARAAASTLKKRSGFILDFYTRKKLTVIFQKPCSRYSPERWIGLRSASGGSFSSWRLSRMSTTISSLRIRTLTPGAIRKCADLVWMKSKERTGESILRTHC